MDAVVVEYMKVGYRTVKMERTVDIMDENANIFAQFTFCPPYEY